MTVTKLANDIVLYHRDEWATEHEQPQGGTPRQLRDITEMIVHHTGGAVLGNADTRTWLRNIYHEHVDGRGYADIAYGFAVDNDTPTGIWELRSPLLVPAATGGHNEHSHAGVYLRDRGDHGDDGKVPNRVERAFHIAYELTQLAVKADGGDPNLGEKCHKDYNPTACPMPDLADWVHWGGLHKGPR